MKTRLNKVRASAPGLTAIALFIGCGAPNEASPSSDAVPAVGEVGVDRAELMRGLDFGNDGTCTEDDKAVFRQAMVLGRTITQSPALAQCVDLVMRTGETIGPLTYGPYHFCSGDQFPGSSLSTQISKVQALMKSTNHVLISSCWDGDGGGLTAGEDRHSYTFTGDEKYAVGNIDLSRIRSVSSSTTEGLGDLVAGRVGYLVGTSATVWHEAMHTHGYSDRVEDCGGAINAQRRSVSELVEYCMERVAKQSAEKCDMLDCPKSGYIRLVNSYPVTASTTCPCYRDTSVAPTTPSELMPTLVQDANEAEDLFGFATASGDFNGDGFDDLAVGAPGENDDTGAVYIYYGSVFGLGPAQHEGSLGISEPGRLRDWANPDWAPAGAPGDLYGRALAVADFNRDGEDDLAVGAPGKSGGGAVFLYRGTRSGLVRTSRFLSPSPSAEFGFSLAAGDFRSGASSLVVGAPNAGSRGAVYVYQGQTSNTEPLLFWSSLQPSLGAGARFGAAVAIGPSARSLGALAVGAPNDSSGGRVYVYDGNVAVNGSFSYRVSSPNAEAQAFGSALAIGNVGGGGRQLAVGAPFHSSASAAWIGAVHYFTDNRTSTGGSTPLHYTQEAPASNAGALFGFSMTLLGSDDLLVGSPNEIGGRVWQYRNGPVGNDFRAVLQRTISQLPRSPIEPEDTFGIAIAVGDFDGNDLDDIAVGASGEAPGSDPGSGAVLVRRRTAADTWVPGAIVTQTD